MIIRVRVTSEVALLRKTRSFPDAHYHNDPNDAAMSVSSSSRLHQGVIASIHCSSFFLLNTRVSRTRGSENQHHILIDNVSKCSRSFLLLSFRINHNPNTDSQFWTRLLESEQGRIDILSFFVAAFLECRSMPLACPPKPYPSSRRNGRCYWDRNTCVQLESHSASVWTRD